MPLFLVTKRVQANTIAEAIKYEKDATIVEVTDMDEPEEPQKPFGFGACG